MRIVLALLMCCGVAFAQDTTKYFKSVDYGWNWQRGKFRGGLILPTDTTNNKLGIAQIGATCFAWSGLKWNPIGSTDTTFLVRYYRKNQVDSAILANSPALTLQDVTSNGKTTTDTIIAASFKRTGGTSSQFLKANGSVDNNTYLTSSSLTGYVPYSTYGSNNVSANNFFNGFRSVVASVTQIVLTVDSTPYYLVTGSGGQTIKLPNATTLPNGTLFTFNNNQSSGAIFVNNNSNTLVKSIPSGGNVIIELIDNSIAAGSWDAHSQAPSNVEWSTNTFKYPGSITDATWNGVNVALNRGGTGASTAAGARTNLGSTTVGDNFFTLTNPSAKRFTQINSDNTVSTLDSVAFRTAIGAGTSSTNGTVTSIVAGTGLNGGTITTSGTISADTSILATKLLLQKKIDSVNANVSAKGSGTVTSITLGRGITGTSPITTTATIGLDTTLNYTFTGNNIFSGRTYHSGNTGFGIAYPQNIFSASALQYSTGTASQSTTVITGVGTTFTSAMVGSQFIFANGTSAGYITAFVSTTSLQVSVSQTVTSQAFTINYQGLRGNNNNFAIGSPPAGNIGPFLKIGGFSVTNLFSITGGNLWSTLVSGYDAATNTDGDGSIASYTNSSNSATSGALRFIRANSSGAVTSGWQLGEVSTYGSYTTTPTFTDRSSAIRFYASQTHSSTAAGTFMTFATTPNSTVTLTEAMRIQNSQNVCIGTTTDATSAILNVVSTTKGVLFPRMTTTQKNAISTPVEGMIVYDLTLHKLSVYTGSVWETITSL